MKLMPQRKRNLRSQSLNQNKYQQGTQDRHLVLISHKKSLNLMLNEFWIYPQNQISRSYNEMLVKWWRCRYHWYLRYICKIWTSTVTFTASKPIEIEVLHGYKPQAAVDAEYGEPDHAILPNIKTVAISTMTMFTDTLLK